MRTVRLLLIVVLFASIACAPTDGSADGSSAAVNDVDWENYSPTLQSRIDDLAAKGDCAGLQNEFDTAEQNDTAQRERVGDGNSDLMGYIDKKLTGAGCYE